MKYVPPLGSVDPDAAYQNGNPSAGIPGSIVPAAAIEHPQRELLHVILKAGLTPDENTLTQLYEAIVKIVGVEVPLASVMEAGLVKIGDGLQIGEDGTLSVKSSDLLEDWRKSWIGVPRYWRSTVLPDDHCWANGDFVSFSNWPELHAVYEAGGLEGMLLGWDATDDPHTRVHTGSRPAQVLNGKPLTQSAYATATPPPASIAEGHVARWTGTAWETVEDHRQHMDSKGTKTGGTPYWLPAEGDDHTSPPRYMETPGPLPAGAVTERPSRPFCELLADAMSAKHTEIQTGYDAALAASLTMPAAAPSAQDVAVGAALFAVDDAEGLAFVQSRHAARRDELLAAVDAADSVEAVRAVDVSYDV